MKYSPSLFIAIALSLTLAGCFRDTPTEPGVQRVPIGSAAVTVGTATFLGHLGGGYSSAYDITNSGMIVGVSRTGSAFTEQGFWWQNGTMTEINTDEGGQSIAHGINEDLTIVGQASRLGAVYASPFSQWEALSFSSEQCSPENSIVYAVNSSGEQAGSGERGTGCPTRPIASFEEVGAMDLGSLGGTSGEAYDINDNLQVVGWSQTSLGHRHAFLWQNGTMSDLGTLGGSQSEAYGINSFGEVAGSSTTSSGSTRAVLWEGGGKRDLGTLGGSLSIAYGINDNRQVVGESQTATGQTRAFVWYNGKMNDFGPASRVSRAINNSGQAVGEGVAPDGSTQGVRWTLPAVNLWAARASLPSARAQPAVAAANGLVYAIGGVSSAGTLSSVVAYNPGTNSWSTKASMPAARRRANGAAAIGSTIYVAGGLSSTGTLTSTLYAYNASTNAWSTKAKMPVTSGCGGSAVISGKLYVFTGCTSPSSGLLNFVGLLHRYDPSTNLWTALRSAPAAHYQPAVGVISGRLYVVGGENADGVATGRLDIYNPATNTWTTRASLATGREGAAGVVVGGRLHVIGGWDPETDTYLKTVEAYDPVTNYWGPRAAMPTGRTLFGVGVINNLVYAVGGQSSTTALSTKNERYKP